MLIRALLHGVIELLEWDENGPCYSLDLNSERLVMLVFDLVKAHPEYNQRSGASSKEPSGFSFSSREASIL